MTITNMACCGVIGAAFGFASRLMIPCIFCGLAVGLLLGLATEAILRAAGLPKRRYLRGTLAILIVEVLAVIYVVIPTYGAYHTVHPARIVATIAPADVGLSYEEVTLLADDGIRLRGWYVPSTNGAAIIAIHGLDGNRAHMIPYMRFLAEQGYGLLAFDMRAHGESDGDKFARGWESDLDVLAAVRYLETRGDVEAGRIGALGLSAGANAALYGAARTDQIRAIVADGTGLVRTEDALGPLLPEVRPLFFMVPMNWMYHKMVELFSGAPAGPPIKEQLPLISPRPILFIAAGQDSLERGLARRYHQLSSPDSELWIVPGVAHLGGLQAHPEEYQKQILSFFDLHLHLRSLDDNGTMAARIAVLTHGLDR